MCLKQEGLEVMISPSERERERDIVMALGVFLHWRISHHYGIMLRSDDSFWEPGLGQELPSWSEDGTKLI